MWRLKKFLKVITFLIFIFPVHSMENKIILKIDNEIITSQDILEESNYLSILNPSLKNLSKNEIFDISKKSLTREKIKEIEIKKNFNQLVIEDDTFNKFLITNAKKFNLDTAENFLKFIENANVDPKNFRKKITIDILWNQLIFQKYSARVKIDKEILKNKIINQKEKSFLLSEIVYRVEKLSEQKKKIEDILKSINVIGFENTALNYSISESAKLGGNIGWVDESSLNPEILNQINKLEINEFTDSVKIPGGFLILQLKDIREIENEINFEKKLQELILVNTNQQLNQYSNIYYNKVSRDVLINEK